MTAPDRTAVLHRRSFLEGDALARALMLLDDGVGTVLCGPFDRIESPWLVPQGIVPQSDDGVVIVHGTIDDRTVVIASIEQGFQGGGTGEVSGAKIATALHLAVRDTRRGRPTAAVLLLETGGVRLQEANLGLNAVAEICSAILDLRDLAPVVGVVAGEVGCFGGMSIAAGLCTRLIVTPQARIGLNGPAVIEQEAGVAEFDSSDRTLIWSVDGGSARTDAGLADTLIPDDADRLRAIVGTAVADGVPPSPHYRSTDLTTLAHRIATVRPQHLPPPAEPPDTRGRTWLTALSESEPVAVLPSVLRTDGLGATLLAVVPDPANPFHRARHGEVGLTEALALANAIDATVAEDAASDDKRAIVAVVDLPSQAYGRLEETAGLHQAIAAAVDAYHRARNAGHPIVTLVVGEALSGGFLAHGLQAQQILALDDPGVRIHAMHEEPAARITQRTVAELERLAKTILPLSFDVRDWAQLGFCDGLLTVSDADHPTTADVEDVRDALRAAVVAARSGPRDLSNRLDSSGARENRRASRSVRDRMTEEWPT